MNEKLPAFLIWAAMGLLFVILGVHAFFAKKPQHFWANVKMAEVTDVKKYNRAVGKLFIAFGAVFALIGLPLLMENEAWVILSVLGTVLSMIVMMVIYSTVIETKYKKENKR